MDNNCVRQARLIKQVHIAVWLVLLGAGGLLCSRVISDRRSTAVAQAAPATAPEQASAETQPVGEPVEQSTVAVVDVESKTEPPAVVVPRRRSSMKTDIEEAPKAEDVAKAEENSAIELIDVEAAIQPSIEPPTLDPADLAEIQSNGSDLDAAITQVVSGDEIADPSLVLPTRKPSAPVRVAQIAKPVRKPDVKVVVEKPQVQTAAVSAIANGPSSDSQIVAEKPVVESVSVAATEKVTAASTTELPPESETPASEKTKQLVTKPVVSTRTVGKTTPPKPSNDLVIENPKKIGYPVGFLFGDEVVQLQPGDKFKKSLDDAEVSKQEIVFDRGGEFGEAVFKPKVGHFAFTVTRQGWKIVPVPKKNSK